MMQENKGFFDIFRRYVPNEKYKRILEKATAVVPRVSKDPYRIETTVFFPMLVAQRDLSFIEEDLCHFYQCVSFRFVPSFPSACFSLACMADIMEEVARTGAVTKGFFSFASYSMEEDCITIEIPYTKDGVEVVKNGGTAELIAKIIAVRFGLNKKVLLVSSDDAEEQSQARDKQMQSFIETLEAEQRLTFAQHSALVPEEPTYEKKPSLSNETPEVLCLSSKEVKLGHLTFDTEEPTLIFGTSFLVDTPTPLATLQNPCGTVLVFGEVFAIDSRENRDGTKVTYTIHIWDATSSIQVKKSMPIVDASWAKKLAIGDAVAVRGTLYREKFDQELALTPKSIYKIKRKQRQDLAEEKRVELHLHTTMSSMDALIRPKEVVQTALRWGHKAIAVTDHGNVQAFPLLMKEARKTDLKIIYGMEAYYVNDTARAIYGVCSDTRFDQTFVVFDIETTGLSALNCKITEIAAVKIKNGEEIDSFSTFVNPEVPIPAKIQELTGITDDMVKDAPKVKEALTDFLAFVGSCILVAHNASFDIGFIRYYAEQNALDFQPTYLDTVSLSRYLNPTQKKHTLDAVAKLYKLGDFEHHRAIEDTRILSLIFIAMLEQLKTEGVHDLVAMERAMSEHADPLKLRMHHLIMLAQNQTGLKNMYRMISESYLTYYKSKPRIPRSLLEKYREGVLIGSACEAGELYTAILDAKSDTDLEEIASFYDYLEIQPLCNNRFLIDAGKVADEEGLADINRKIIALGKKLGKKTVATCDAHFLEKEDEIYRKILLAGLKFADADKDTGIYLRTTDEMLDEFSYLGETLAREVVIENPTFLADSVEKLLPIPDGTFTPTMPGAEEELKKLCYDRAMDWYGFEGTVPSVVTERLNKELDAIIKYGFSVLYMISQKLVAYSEELGYLVGSRGSVGSSVVAIMSGISEVNPLPPHYRCPQCRYSAFFLDGSVGSGFDLPDAVCPHCQTELIMDGQDIPFETFLGFEGDKAPDIDLNFSGDVQGRVHKYTEELFGEGNVFRAGTLGTLASKTAFGFVAKYLESHEVSLPKAEVEHMISRCVGVKRTTGQHPGGIIVVPREKDIYDFSPVQHPADDATSHIITTHFPFEYLHDTILKLDELGHDMPTKYKMLERYTGTSVLDVKMNDPNIYALFASCEPLGVTKDDIGCELGTLGLPEMGTHFIQSVLVDAKPKNFADLLQISGLTHGTNVWLGNAQDLIKEGICNISQVVATRDGIMLYLIRKGIENKTSFKIMEDVRKGKGLLPEYEKDMIAHDVPEWYITSCKKIKYMFPKAHAAAYVMSAIRLGWYKLYYPMEFYAAFLSVASGGFDAEIVAAGRGAVNKTLREIEEKGNEATQKENEQSTTLMLVRECMARGIAFSPVHLNHSDAFRYLPENGKIRMPFVALSGLGETAAERIVQVRDSCEILSIEELKRKAGLSTKIVDLLRNHGALGDLSETNQISMF